MRIITKWCEQLKKCFQQKQVINRENPFRMKDGSQKYLTMFEMRLLNEFLQIQLLQIQDKLEKLKDNNYQNSAYFLLQNIESNLNMLSDDQAYVGRYSSAMFKINQNYLINYLNWLMHGINFALANFQRYKMYEISQRFQNSKNKILTSNITLKNKQTSKQQIYQIFQILQNAQFDLNRLDIRTKALSQTPQLITFKIGDLLRCKCTSKQSQIIALYRQVQRISLTQPKQLRIIRVKNKLDQANKDILMNLLYKDTMMVEMQLAIKSEKSKFIDNSNKFNHYFYEMKRAQFGSIMEMCSIWMSQDQRAVFYQQNLSEKNIRKINIAPTPPLKDLKDRQKQQQSSCCQLRQNQQIQNLPFKCNTCECFYFDCSFYQTHIHCIQCNKYQCFRCQFQRSSFLQKQKLVPAIITYYQGQFEDGENGNENIQQFQQIKDEIPDDGGAIIDLKSREQKAVKFKTIFYEDKYYLFQDLNETINDQKQSQSKSQNANNQDRQHHPNIKLLFKFDSYNIPQKFIQSKIIFKLQQFQIPQITYQDAQKYYFIPKYLKDCQKAKKQSMILINKNIDQKDLLHIFAQALNISPNTNIKQWNKFKQNPMYSKKQWASVHKINVSENNFSNVDLLLMKFPNVQLALLSNNKIEEINLNLGLNENVCWKNLQYLYLSKNRIRNANFIIQFKNLIELDLSYNDIQTLPDKIDQLLALQKFNCQSNAVKKLPSNIGSLVKLTQLNLNKNDKITELPDKFCLLQNLQILNLDCFLDKLPQQFGKLKQLMILNINSNQLVQLPQSLMNLQKLQTLYMRDNKIKKFPFGLLKMRSLQYLALSGNKNMQINLPPNSKNKQKDIPNYNTSKIKSLQLSNMELTSLPTWIHTYLKDELTILDLRKNKLTKVPQWISQMGQLQILDISYNNISQLPAKFWQLDSVVNINISNNKIENLVQTKTMPNIDQYNSLNVLNLSQNKFRQLPKWIDKFRALTTLNLYKTGISVLPDEICTLQNLKTLNVSNNTLKKIPQQIGLCQQLDYINLSNNQIQSIPESIGYLQQLTYLNLQSNRLQKLPQSIGSLESLKMLNLSNNRLVALTDSVCKLQKLVYLDIGMNENLKELPKQFGNLYIAVLKMVGVGVRKLPDSFDKLYYLKSLYLGFTYNAKQQQTSKGKSQTSPPTLMQIQLSPKFWQLPQLQHLELYTNITKSTYQNYLKIKQLIDLKYLKLIYLELQEKVNEKIIKECQKSEVKYHFEKVTNE